MKCSDALEAMLVAEPAELSVDGRGPLANHLRGCERCRRVAARITGGTELLASAIEARRAAPAPRFRMARYGTAIPAAMAAGLLVVAVVRHEGWRGAVAPMPAVTNTTAAAGRPHDTVPPSPLALGAVDQAPINDAGVDPSQDGSFAVYQTGDASDLTTAGADSTAAPADSTTALGGLSSGDSLRFGLIPPSPRLADVSVRSAPGKRVAILHTSDPKTTIIWLY